MSDLVIGCGEIGGPLADILSITQEVYRLDCDPTKSDADIPHKVGVMHICFPFDPKDASKFILGVVDYVSKYDPSAVFIHSTVPPGTTSMIGSYVGSFTRIFYSPVRGRHTEMHRDLMRYRKFLAAVHSPELKIGVELLEQRWFDVAVMESTETLELAKLLETTYSGLLIAWAQEMERYAQKAGADREEALGFTAEIDYLPGYIFQPGRIGGHCIMQNLDLLDFIRESSLVTAIRESNEDDALPPSMVRLRPARLSDG